MKTIKLTKIIITMILAGMMLNSCSNELPDQIAMYGWISVKLGDYKRDPNYKRYSQDVVIDININKATEDIKEAYLILEGKTFTLEGVDPRKGGSVTVTLDNLSLNRQYSAVVYIISEHFKSEKRIDIFRTEANFCKISNFKVTPVDSKFNLVNVSFRIDENPYLSNKPIELTIENEISGYNRIAISEKSEVGNYNYTIPTELLNQVYKFNLVVGGSYPTDGITYETPKSKTNINVICDWTSLNYDFYQGRIIVDVPNYSSIPGTKRVEFWIKHGTGTYDSFSYWTQETLNSSKLIYEWNVSRWKDRKYKHVLVKLYSNDELWATGLTKDALFNY